QSGFAGILAASAPRLEGAGCKAERATLYGKVAITRERPRFTGPLRVGALTCPDMDLTLAGSGVQIDGRLDKAFDGFEAVAGLRTGTLAYGANRASGLGGKAELSWRKGRLTSSYSLAANGVATSAASFATVASEGRVRAANGFTNAEIEGDLTGEGIELGDGLDKALAATQRSAADTLAEPLIARLREGLAREEQGSSLAANFTLRKTGDMLSAAVPQASLRGGSGATVVALSRAQVSTVDGGAARISGNFSTGGEGLPRIAGRMERQTGGGVLLRMSMAEYRAGDASIALPELVLVQGANGAIGFSGNAQLSGALPGGSARNLQLPLSGTLSSSGGLALWRGCTDLRFDSLAFANVTLERRALTLCPPRGSAIVEGSSRGTRVAAGAPSLDLRGRLGETPIALRSGPVGIAWPGALSAKQLDIALGPAATATRFRLNDLSAKLGDEISGKFAGADVLLYAVPLDVLSASGSWRYAGGKLTLSDGAFRVEDREQVDRFAPLIARDATLALADNVIVAEALLREPKSDRAITRATMRHDLSTGRGHADLAVEALAFDRTLQPDTLTPLALGVVANVSGTVTGDGRIDWNENGVTSSGKFSSDALDFAAAFGPVKGASGTVVFTDLLGLTTAPGQVLTVKSVNPGIEVNDGSVRFRLVEGRLLAIEGGSWPFMGGTLTLRPLDFNIGATEVRRYVLEVEGLQAALFVQRMELGNISATGVFDGTLPLVFDQNGGRIEGGLLISRPPGGNLSYVGDLTYKDLTTMANFAFDALKSLDYTQMRIAMDGDLTGEIVTRAQFDGVKQGTGAKRNFLTQRFANLPIRFNINLKAPFYKLITTVKTM
ncbi:MAG TPA: YdbH domain-containing protein, partial [Croceibacterium sp.]|nr:YdbH domain-containing protein [Croceibacterium sp.]